MDFWSRSASIRTTTDCPDERFCFNQTNLNDKKIYFALFTWFDGNWGNHYQKSVWLIKNKNKIVQECLSGICNLLKVIFLAIYRKRTLFQKRTLFDLPKMTKIYWYNIFYNHDTKLGFDALFLRVL